MRGHNSEDYEAFFEINIKGVFNSVPVELCYIRMAKSDAGGGTIVHLASIPGLVDKPDCSVNSASKHAAVELIKAVASSRLSSGTRVNAIGPVSHVFREFRFLVLGQKGL